MLATMANVLVIEVFAAGTFDWGDRLLSDPEVSAEPERAGAMVRWCEILNHASLRSAHPLLVAAVEHVAHYQIRNRGTIGGSIAHADPAAEMPGVALTCEAEIAVVGTAGPRTIQSFGVL